MKILFTNNTLDVRAGSELATLELARGLQARGHTPLVFSTRLGEVAEDFRRATIPVLDDLTRLTAPPDLLHLQHHLEALTALLQFPGVPAVFVCHGWLPWEETPLRFPRIRRWVAVDEPTRDRLELEAGIAAERLELLLNWVDLERFRRPPEAPALPATPRRALLFSNQSAHLPAVQEACARAGLALDVMGRAAGRPEARPEAFLPTYDLVFAKARAALEALAAGAAVVLCDHTGVGPLVTSADFDRLRRLNFGIRALGAPLAPDLLVREIARYDPADAARVTERVRAEAGLEAAVERYLDLYQRVLAEHHAAPAPCWEDESRAVAAYLRWLNPHLRERELLAADNQALRAALEAPRPEAGGALLRAGWRWLSRQGT